jgi:hypothetical protein
MMNLRERLSKRIGMNQVREINQHIQQDNSQKQELFDLLLDPDERISFQAAWVIVHFSPADNEWLYRKQDELINQAIKCQHSGKQRLILNILYRQPFDSPPRVDFLDFCLEKTASHETPFAIQSQCMKLAYEMCREIPELCQELHSILDMLDPQLLAPSVRATRRNVLKVISKRRNLGQD